MKKKRRTRDLSVMLIPDDYADPISFKISFTRLKILGVLVLIIVTHLIAGAVFYWKFYEVSVKNRKLIKKNTELSEDNKKVYSMSEIVNDVLIHQDRVKAALGINRGFETSNRRNIENLSMVSPSIDVIPNQPMPFEENKKAEGKLDFLDQSKSRKSSYHDFAENVPTYLPVEGFLTTDYREADWFIPSRHLGIDIAAKKGTSVRAAAGGTVLFANWTNELGNLIIIDHLNGFVTYYGHNQMFLKKERSTVEKGEIIAKLGSSGMSTAPHLHFEIRKNGVPVDPKEYLIYFQSR